MSSSTEAVAYQSVLTFPTYTRQPARRLPSLFQDGWTGIYPDTRDDILGGPKRDVDYRAVILENAHLKLTILPQLGGKLFSVYDKHAQDDAVYVPDVIKPGLIARPGAWIPGGMEFNFPTGHHIMGMRPVPCAIINAGPKVAKAVIHYTCAHSGLQMDVCIALAAGEARFTIEYVLANPTPLAHRWYQWTNVGVQASDRWRFFSKAKYYSTGLISRPYPIEEDGSDSSWYINRPYGSDSFMVGHRENFFGYYDYDREIGIAHVAPWQQVRGKKYFTWGYQVLDYDPVAIFSDAGQNYLEIQAGPMETQMNWDIMQPGEGREYSTTWIPYSRTGGIDFADTDLIFQVDDNGAARVFSAIDQTVVLRVNGRAAELSLPAGRSVKAPDNVRDGDRVELFSGGKLKRAFTYPFEGEQEPDTEKWIKAHHAIHQVKPPKTASDWLKRARNQMKADQVTAAITSYRNVLERQPNRHDARLELADALWHIADFDAGKKELETLLDTSLREQARQKLNSLPEAEAAFFKPIDALPDGTGRALALAERYAGYCATNKAVAIYRKLVKSEPANWRVHYGLAMYFRHDAHDPKKAVRHARRALELNPNDRDLIIELIPIFANAGDHRRIVSIINGAPKPIRELSILQKYLAAAYWELGELDLCWRISSRKRLFNWEGETGHADIAVNCAMAIAEDALAAGDIKKARKMVDSVTVLPKNLGLLKRHFNIPVTAYWDGLIAVKEGRKDDAVRIWRDAVRDTEKEIDYLSKRIYGPIWARWFDEEIVFTIGMCARLSGNAGLVKKTDRLSRRAHELRDKYTLPHHGSDDYFNGIMSELAGEFDTAGRSFKKHLKTAAVNRFIVQRHLDAVTAGKRRGEH